MKLALKAEGKWHVLAVSEAINEKEYAVLRAGVIKLLNTGKTMLAIDIHQATGWDPKHFAPLAPLHKLAQELQGAVVLIGPPQSLQGAPEDVPHFATLAEAKVSKPAVPAGETAALQRELAETKAILNTVQRQLETLWIDRRHPTAPEALKAQILELEATLTDLRETT